MGTRTAGSMRCPVLPGDSKATASDNACNYMAKVPSPETAQHLALLKPDKVRVVHAN